MCRNIANCSSNFDAARPPRHESAPPRLRVRAQDQRLHQALARPTQRGVRRAARSRAATISGVDASRLAPSRQGARRRSASQRPRPRDGCAGGRQRAAARSRPHGRAPSQGPRGVEARREADVPAARAAARCAGPSAVSAPSAYAARYCAPGRRDRRAGDVDEHVRARRARLPEQLHAGLTRAARCPCGGCTARTRRRCSPSSRRRPWSAG